MHRPGRSRSIAVGHRTTLAAALSLAVAAYALGGKTAAAQDAGVAVGAQYDTTHVYVAPADFDAFVNSFVATFGGKPSKRTVAVPFPFGEERTGYLVTNMDQAIKAARAAGAEVIVEPFKDPIGMDTVIQWPGGVKMQLYWHFTPSTNPPLETIPENRVYVSRDQADGFVNSFMRFAHGRVVADDKHADAAEIGGVGETYRRIQITSLFGNMLVLVTNGHLPYPFGHETTGYQVQDLGATLDKAKAAGVKVLSATYTGRDRTATVVEFPGGYIAEIHGLPAR